MCRGHTKEVTKNGSKPKRQKQKPKPAKLLNTWKNQKLERIPLNTKDKGEDGEARECQTC